MTMRPNMLKFRLVGQRSPIDGAVELVCVCCVGLLSEV